MDKHAYLVYGVFRRFVKSRTCEIVGTNFKLCSGSIYHHTRPWPHPVGPIEERSVLYLQVHTIKKFFLVGKKTPGNANGAGLTALGEGTCPRGHKVFSVAYFSQDRPCPSNL